MQINQIILKITSICNLSCKYCYVFNKDDKSYRLQNDVISRDVIDAFIDKLTDYQKNENNAVATITFHGGEPLMAGKDVVENIASLIRRQCGKKMQLSIQTNGTLVDSEWCDIFNRNKISVGISIDGNRQANRKRVFANQRVTFDKVIGSYNLLKERGVNVGVLSVISTKCSPIDYYSFLKDYNITHVDCLFPDATYETIDKSSLGIGIWLSQLFDLWFKDNKRPSIRLFESILKLIFDPFREVGGEMFGSTTNGVVDINPNGDIDIPDTLKICNKNLISQKYSIFKNTLQDICCEKNFKLFYLSHSEHALSTLCQQCIIKPVCGGGILAHRYSIERGFDNPSVYCYDLFMIIKHIQNTICDETDRIKKIQIEDFKAWH